MASAAGLPNKFPGCITCLLDLVSPAGLLAHTKASHSTRIVIQPIVSRYLALLPAALAVTPSRSWALSSIPGGNSCFLDNPSPPLPFPLSLPLPCPPSLSSACPHWAAPSLLSVSRRRLFPKSTLYLSSASRCLRPVLLFAAGFALVLHDGQFYHLLPAGPHRSRPSTGHSYIPTIHMHYTHFSHPTAEAPTHSQK